MTGVDNFADQAYVAATPNFMWEFKVRDSLWIPCVIFIPWFSINK